MLKKDLQHLINTIKTLPPFLLLLVKKNFLFTIFGIIVYSFLFLIDPLVRNLFTKLHNSTNDIIISIGHFYGKPYLIVFSIVLFYLVGIINKKEKIRKIGLKFFESFLISGIIVTVIKSLLGRWRPYTGNGNFAFIPFTLGPNDHLSLPSGDVATAFAFSVIAASLIKNKFWNVFWFLLATISAIGRIYNDQHWLTDVTLAAIISMTVGYHIIQQKEERK